ncbi:hypothetical protein H8959_006816 [Pygathrix nigripes]
MGIQLILPMTREVKLSSEEWGLGITLEENILVRAKPLGGFQVAMAQGCGSLVTLVLLGLGLVLAVIVLAVVLSRHQTPCGPQAFAHATVAADSKVCSNIGLRERSKVPYIVHQCVEEIELQGMEEVGIYRVSGVAMDIQALKAAFNVSQCWPGEDRMESHQGDLPTSPELAFCAGPLKSSSTRAGVSLQHSQGRGHSLPEDSSVAQPLCLSPGGGIETAPSASVLYRVAEKEAVNKMSLHNFATVFGPTLL